MLGRDPLAPHLRFGPFALDVRAGELRNGPLRIKIPDQSVAILKALLERPGEVVMRDELRERLWPSDTFVDFEHGLNTAVRRLREALGDSAERPKFIETLPRRGYRFIGTVDGVASAVPAAPHMDIANTTRVATDTVAPGRVRERVAWLMVGVLGLALIAGLVVSRRFVQSASVEPTVFLIAPPEGTEFQQDPQLALSPDGRLLAFAAVSGGHSQLWLKSRTNPDPTPIAGTEGAAYPFWSPDNQFIAFFASRRLLKVRVGGGRPEVICDAPAGRGGTWNRHNEIVFAPGSDGPLRKVSAAGGATVAATALDKSRQDTTHRHPNFLPDGNHFVFLAGGGPTSGEITIGSLDSREEVWSTGLLGGRPNYSSGHILFVRNNTLVARPFDEVTRQFKAHAVTVAEDVSSFSVAEGSILAHASQPVGQLTWLDRTGNAIGTIGDAPPFEAPAFMVALSSDKARLATSRRVGSPPNLDIVLFDLTRPTGARRFTFAAGSDFFPVWAPKGTHVVFASTRNGRYQLYLKRADLTDTEQLLLDDSVPPQHIIAPTDWSRDGNYIAYTKSGSTHFGISILPLSGSRTPFAFQASPPGNKGQAHFSPDGRWVAYTSDESGKGREVYVSPFPGGGAVHQISDGGGTQPLWSEDGKELFFFGGKALMRTAINTGPEFQAGVPEKLFSVSANLTIGFGNEYAVSKDGRQFLVNVLSTPKPITMVLDWLALTER